MVECISRYKLQLSSEWNVESVQNLKFPEDMIEVTQIASFLYEIDFQAQKTIIEQDTTVRSKHKAKIFEKGNEPEKLAKSRCALFLHNFHIFMPVNL